MIHIRNHFFSTLWQYIFGYRAVIAAYILFCITFATVFSLYTLEAEAVFYASALCFIFGIIILGLNFFHFYRKHSELVRIQKNIMLLSDKLPAASNLIETDYQNIIEDLRRINLDITSIWKSERSDSIDYYTTWVHQIKTPIAVMQLLLQDDDTAENLELLSELFSIEQYTEMVLCYFRLDSTSSDFIFRNYVLDNIIRTAVRKYAPQFVRKRIRLQYDGTDYQVLTDEKWLLFILEQLLSNAIKYTESGSITITVDDNKVLTIADTGIGIAADDLPRIFEKGFTGYNGHANKKSTGLGLFLCKQAANKLSHHISIASTVSSGTIVSIDLSTIKLDTH